MKQLVIIAILILIGGCTKTIYVPVETVTIRNDSAYKAVYIDRLIVERDTVNTYTKGDTVFQERIKWRVRNTETHDTIVQLKTDSIEVAKPYPVEVVKEVEKKLRWWQTALIWIGIASIIGVCISVWRLIRCK